MFPQAKWTQFEPAGPHSARAAASMVFGKPVHTYYNFADADVVVSLDSDFLGSGFASTRYAGDFAKRRRRGDRLDMNRLYVAESSMTATGGNADHRLALHYAEMDEFAQGLLNAVWSDNPGTLHAAWVKATADDLKAHRGACIVIPGEHQSREVHALAHVLNAELGNNGKTVFYKDPIKVQPVDQIASLRELAAK